MKKTINLCAFREAVQKTQREIADILNVGQSYVSEIESGKKCISKDKLGILVERFGQDVCDRFMIEANVSTKFNAPVNSCETQHVTNQINGSVQNSTFQASDDNSHELERCKEELAKTKTELERAQKRIDKLMEIIENLSRE